MVDGNLNLLFVDSEGCDDIVALDIDIQYLTSFISYAIHTIHIHYTPLLTCGFVAIPCAAGVTSPRGAARGPTSSS